MATEERDKGEKRIRKLLKTLDGSFVTVGVHDGTGSYPNGVLISQVAFWNEFGAGDIPQRSFIRSAISENINEIKLLISDLQGKLLSGAVSIENALGKIGRRGQEDIKKKILTGPFIPNAPSTLKGKDGTKPLVDTRLLLRSINHEVTVK